MFMLDIDNFKKVNDEFGHAIGDSMLKSVASALKKLSSDNKLFCARYGGDEFCVLTKMITRDAEKELEDSIRRACSVDGFDFTVGISIGYVKCDYTVDADAKALFNRADAKMYAEKQGKKRIGAE
jgi:diguanylate cyclase (GGDEF)-like protein